MPTFQAFLKSESGVAMLEFALALIPLVILLTGGITYAGVLAAQLTLNNAANEGARAGIAGLSLCERETLALEAAQDGLTIGDPGAATINAMITNDKITITIDYAYTIAAVTPILFPVPDTLSTTAIARTDDPIIPSC